MTSVTKLNTAAMKDLIDAGYDIGNGTFHSLVAGTIVVNSTAALEAIGKANQELVDRLEELENTLPELLNLTAVAGQHTSMLRNRVRGHYIIRFFFLHKTSVQLGEGKLRSNHQ